MTTKITLTLVIIFAAFSMAAQQKKVKINLVPHYLTNAQSITFETTFSGKDMISAVESQSLMTEEEKQKLRWHFAGYPFKDDVAKFKEKLNQQMAFLHTDNLLTGELDLLVKIEFSNLGKRTSTNKQKRRVVTSSGYWETQEHWVTSTSYACTYILSVLNKNDNKVLFTKNGSSSSNKMDDVLSPLVNYDGFTNLFPKQIKAETNSYKLFEQIGMMDSKAILKLIEKGQDVNFRHYETKETLLMHCLNNKQAINTLLENGAKINAQDAKNNTVLHHLAEKYPADLEMFEFLIKKGADLSIKNETGSSGEKLLKEVKQNALNKSYLDAFEANTYKSIEYSVKQGANIDVEKPFSGKIYVKNATPVFHAFSARNFKLIKQLAKLGADLNKIFTIEDYSGTSIKRTMLIYALVTNDIEMVDSLIAFGPVINFSFEGKTLLDLAYQSKIIDKEKLIEFLVKRGAIKNNDFYKAIDENNIELVKKHMAKGYPLNGTHILLTGHKNWSPVYYAANIGNVELVKFFVKSGAKYYSHSPLDETARKNNKTEAAGKIKEFMTELKAGEKNLYQAIMDTNFELVKEIINSGFDINGQEYFPVFVATQVNSLEIAEYLIKNGADISVPYNLMFYAKSPEMVKLLMKNGVDVTHKNKENRTPFDAYIYYSKGHDILLAKAMIEAGLDPNIMLDTWAVNGSKTKAPPLYIVCAMKNMYKQEGWLLQFAKMLVERGADPKYEHVLGSTLLLPCIYNRYFKVAEYLIKQGADPYKKNKYGTSAYKEAKKKKLSSLLELMKENR